MICAGLCCFIPYQKLKLTTTEHTYKLRIHLVQDHLSLEVLLLLFSLLLINLLLMLLFVVYNFVTIVTVNVFVVLLKLLLFVLNAVSLVLYFVSKPTDLTVHTTGWFICTSVFKTGCYFSSISNKQIQTTHLNYLQLGMDDFSQV